MELSVEQQKTDTIQNVPPISIVWLDDSIDSSEENIACQQQLSTLDSNLKTHKDDNECEQYIKSQSTQSRFVLIVNGRLGKIIVPRVHEALPQIISIYVFCFNKSLHEEWAKNFTKVKDVVTQFDELKNKIQMNYFNDNSATVDQPSTVDNQQIEEAYELINPSIISDISIGYLSGMKPTAKDKDDFISLCQSAVDGQPQKMAILQAFQESYASDQALSWFNRDPIFSQILNDTFQHINIEKMYHCRFFIRDIQKQFDQHKFTSTVHVYRGQLMSDEAVQQLKTQKEKIITISSFLSTSLDRNVAITFISEQNEQKRVLYDIEANPQIESVKSFIKMGPFSDYNDENEVVFMLRSSFKINEICDEENGIIVVKMSLCANENDNPFNNQFNDTNEEKDLIGFIQLLCNMSQYLGYFGILLMENTDKLIEKYVNELPEDHPDRFRCYDTLGNVSFAKGDLDSCLTSYTKSVEIKKKFLPSNDLKLAESYNNIASVYLRKGDNTQALDAFKLMLMIYKQVYGDDHHHLMFCYTSMINIYESEGQYGEVLSCYNQIFNIMLKHCPIDDPNFAPIYNNIGKTFVSLGQYSLALGYYETSLKIKIKTLPEPSESIAATYKCIGIVYKHLENMDQARIHFEKAASIYRQIHSPTYETVLEIEQFLKNLAPSLK